MAPSRHTNPSPLPRIAALQVRLPGWAPRAVSRRANPPLCRAHSHPLPKTNMANQVYVQRGYLGATMIVLYMLITTSVAVRR